MTILDAAIETGESELGDIYLPPSVRMLLAMQEKVEATCAKMNSDMDRTLGSVGLSSELLPDTNN